MTVIFPSNVETFIEWFDPCEEGREFLRSCSDVEEAWATCDDPQWLVWAIDEVAGNDYQLGLEIYTAIKAEYPATVEVTRWGQGDLHYAVCVLMVVEGVASGYITDTIRSAIQPEFEG